MQRTDAFSIIPSIAAVARHASSDGWTDGPPLPAPLTLEGLAEKRLACLDRALERGDLLDGLDGQQAAGLAVRVTCNKPSFAAVFLIKRWKGMVWA